MANPNGICAVGINELQADGSYVSYRYWAQVVQMNDPRLPARPRIEVDLVHEWIAGVEPEAATIRFQRSQMRQQERLERREFLRRHRQQEAEAGTVQGNAVLRLNTAVQTEPLVPEVNNTRWDNWSYCPTCGKKRGREEEEVPASPPYSQTWWPTTEDDRRCYRRARTSGQTPSSSTDAQLQGSRHEGGRERAVQGPQMSPFQASTSGTRVRLQVAAEVAREIRR